MAILRRSVFATLLGVPATLGMLIGGEIFIAANGDYLPGDPGFLVDAVVTVAGDVVRPVVDDHGAVRVAVLGDSLVAGVGADGQEGTLPVLVAERVAKELKRDVHVTGFGVSGARVADVLAEQVDLLDGGSWDAVLLVIGGNDTTHATGPGSFTTSLTSVIEEIGSVTGDAPVVLAGIPRFVGVGALLPPLRHIADQYGLLLAGRQERVAAATGAAFADIGRLASPRFRGVPEAMSVDLFHPSPIGYGFWADTIAPVVAGRVGS